MATKADKHLQFSQSQETALACLISGDSTESAACEAGVSRQTLSGWLNHDVHFIAELNRRRMELWADTCDRLRHLGGKALDVVAEDLDCKGDRHLRQRAALAILKAIGLQDLKPTGSTTAEDVELEQARRENSRSLDKLIARCM